MKNLLRKNGSRKNVSKKNGSKKNASRKNKKTKKNINKKQIKYNMYGGIYSEDLIKLISNPNNRNDLPIEKKEITITSKINSTVDGKTLNNNYMTQLQILMEKCLEYPNNDFLEDKTLFIKGGGRVPDIIVNKYDVERAENYLTMHLNLKTTETKEYLSEIISFVRRMLNTEHAVIFEMKNNLPSLMSSWTETIDKATACVKKDRENIKTSSTLSNVTALPYMFGDCREHGILISFFCNVYKNYICKKYNKDCNNQFRAIYSMSYMIDDEASTITPLLAHVFCLMISKGKIWVVDALLSDDNSPNRKQYNTLEAQFIDKNSIANYNIMTGDNDLMSKTFKNNIPILHCGYYYIDNKPKFRVVNIPKNWTNKIEYIDNINVLLNDTNNFNNLLLYNRIINYDNYETKWSTHSEWCNDNNQLNKLL
jgi:hypothetical protein